MAKGAKPKPKGGRSSSAPATSGRRARGAAVAGVVGVVSIALALALRARLAPVHEAGAHGAWTYTPLADALPDAHMRELRWGTYRPGVYAGVKSRTYPESLAAGVMWAFPAPAAEDGWALRHDCLESDGLQKYGYTMHDGRSVGAQQVEDAAAGLRLNTTFVRLDTHSAESWVLAVDCEQLPAAAAAAARARGPPASLLLYAALDREGERARGGGLVLDEGAEPPAAQAFTLRGTSAALGGAFALRLGHVSGSAGAAADGGEAGGAAARARVWSPPDSLGLAELAAEVRRQLEANGGVLPLDAFRTGARTVVVQLQLPPGGAGTDGADGARVLARAQIGFAAAAEKGGGAAAGAVAPPATEPSELERIVGERERAFRARFDAAFPLAGRELGGSTMGEREAACAREALSLLLGSHAFLYGSSVVREAGATGGGALSHTPPAPLFTAVPSRAFFPRGFLWDEGFHQLLGARHDRALALDVLLHWAALVDGEGWVAREQILGAEARARVPPEFVPQQRHVANPPTLLLLLELLLRTPRVGCADAPCEAGALGGEAGADERALARALPALERWYTWLLRSQRSAVADDAAADSDHPSAAHFHGYRWRGRSESDGRLNAMTLASGLDDFPRATTPTQDERHVDLLCWLALGARVLADAARRFPAVLEADGPHYDALGASLRASLDALHWSEASGTYQDWGLTASGGSLVEHVVFKCAAADGSQLEADAPAEKLRRAASSACPRSHPQFLFPLGDGVGGLLTRTRLRPSRTKRQHVGFVGYVSLFPLFLKLIPPASERLGRTIDALHDPSRLWSPHGLRSLSKSDLLYGVPNAPGDAPYWRGPIWINANYLALAGLHHYGARARACAEPARVWGRSARAEREPTPDPPHAAALAPRAPRRARACAANTPGPYAVRARTVYEELRSNVVRTVLAEYERTGFLFEQYNDETGAGQRTRPFNGWTTLVALIMAEMY